MINYERFNKELIRYMAKNPSQRKGQAAMNVLAKIDKPFYDEISGSEYDCFYDDGKLPSFYFKIKEFFNGEEYENYVGD